MQTNVVTTGPTLTYSRDYAEMLRGLQLNFVTIDEHFLRVGEPKKMQGWILHLSVIKTQVQRLMEVVLPKLVDEKVSFKIVKDYQSAKDSLDGSLGYHQLGKIITIYCEDDTRLVFFTKLLIEATEEFRGPAIPTDAHLGSIVYTRYGGMNPVRHIDSAGYTGRYIFNAQGELEIETYLIPFAMPEQVVWPFGEINTPPDKKAKKLLYNNYLITSLLKHDVKGEVFKALRVKRFYPEWCIIKEGRNEMWSDDHGRDIKDRLRWQYHLQKDLYGHVSVPEAYELFEEKNGCYIAMQYIKGKSLHDITQKIHAGKTWHHLHKDQKLSLLSYLLQIIDQCEKLHQKGYVHRDLALANFIVNRRNALVMIDLELAYSLRDQTPHPPFRLGTPGFMSPEQLKTKTPTAKEDIYALGAVMIQLFTSLHPMKFGIYDAAQLKDNLLFLIGHEGIAGLIARCMLADPQDRPSLTNIKTSIGQYGQELTDPSVDAALLNKRPQAAYVQHLLEESLCGMCDLMLKNPIQARYKEIGNPTPESPLSLGWYTGISGMLCVLTQAGKCLATSNLAEAYANGLAYVKQKLDDNQQELAPGLYMGAAGVAMAITAGLENGWIAQPAGWKAALWRLLQLPAVRLDIAHGAAGQGIAVLRSLPFLPQDEAHALLQQYAEVLVNAQHKDGGWPADENVKLKSIGFALGSTGILFFLLEYAKRFPDDTWVREAILRGLDWLKAPAKTSGNYAWLVKNKYKSINLGLDGDIAGAALCFVKAYTTLKDPAYRTNAEDLLRNVPHHLVKNELSLGMGLAGLGEVYLEAALAFESDEWMQRASWVANLILNTSYLENRRRRYWIVTNHTPPSLDLMTGSGGVMQFVLHYAYPDTTGLGVSTSATMKQNVKHLQTSL